MNDLDNLLGALRDERAPAGLAAIDAAVMDELGARRESEFARRGLLLAACIAGSVGLSLGIDGGSPASAEPLLAIPVTAPSQLLGG